MRVDLYTLVHKAQRFHLFNIANEMGVADFTDQSEASRISMLVSHMLEHLKDHARIEETYIHPLYEKIGAVADQLEKQHLEFENLIGELERIIVEKRWMDLYPKFSAFLGEYLIHLDEEERKQRDILWKNYDDDALTAVMNRFKLERRPADARADLQMMLPAMSVPELTRMFLGMKASAPPQAFQGACVIAAQTLSIEKWRLVEKYIRQ